MSVTGRVLAGLAVLVGLYVLAQAAPGNRRRRGRRTGRGFGLVQLERRLPPFWPQPLCLGQVRCQRSL
jgi:hypothetical protein